MKTSKWILFMSAFAITVAGVTGCNPVPNDPGAQSKPLPTNIKKTLPPGQDSRLDVKHKIGANPP